MKRNAIAEAIKSPLEKCVKMSDAELAHALRDKTYHHGPKAALHHFQGREITAHEVAKIMGVHVSTARKRLKELNVRRPRVRTFR